MNNISNITPTMNDFEKSLEREKQKSNEYFKFPQP
ncbi:MAG: hypothetical protein ACI8RD_013578, partial [Bacillariaceae sp.]